MMTEDLYITKRSLELEWQNAHLKSGKVNIRMIAFNKQIQAVIRDIIAQEEIEATRDTKIADAQAEVSIAT